MLVEEFLERSAKTLPDKIALIDGSRRSSYAELDRLANRFAHALVDSGIKRGDRVVVCLDNCSEAVISIFAILKAGAVFVMVDHTTKAERLSYILNDCGAGAIVISTDKIGAAREAIGSARSLRNVYIAGSKIATESAGTGMTDLTELFAGSGPDSAPAKVSIDADLAALIYTSGTTGRPKGVMLTHLNMVSAAQSVISYLENNAEDVFLNVLRLSYSYGLYQVLTCFLVGGTVILERSLAYPYLLLETIRRERVTAFPLVPTIAAVLLQYDLTAHDLSSLRYITSAGAALPQEHAKKLRQALPNVKLFIMYGQTECKRISYLPPDQIDAKAGSAGIAIPNEEIYLIDDIGNRLPPGSTGELIVRGSHVMKGYWGLPEESERALRPGPVPGEKVLHTGDFFRMDEDGYLFFLSRKDDIIKTRGEKVSPKEVEEILYSIEGVVEAAVVGIPDAILGQAVKAVIRLREDVTISRQEVLRHCSRHLEDFKVPKLVEFRNTLPKTVNGKIDRKELRTPVETTA